MDTYIKKNDRCHPLGFPDDSNSYGSFISERRKYFEVHRRKMQFQIFLYSNFFRERDWRRSRKKFGTGKSVKKHTGLAYALLSGIINCRVVD
jgi:hypothetical protein